MLATLTPLSFLTHPHHENAPRVLTLPFLSTLIPIQQEMSATSPPTSPLPKRQKPNPSIMETTTTVTKVDAQPPLLIKKLSDKARLPTRGSAFAAGYDIYAAKDTVVPARGKVLVDTDISMAVPAGTCTFLPSQLLILLEGAC